MTPSLSPSPKREPLGLTSSTPRTPPLKCRTMSYATPPQSQTPSPAPPSSSAVTQPSPFLTRSTSSPFYAAPSACQLSGSTPPPAPPTPPPAALPLCAPPGPPSTCSALCKPCPSTPLPLRGPQRVCPCPLKPTVRLSGPALAPAPWPEKAARCSAIASTQASSLAI